VKALLTLLAAVFLIGAATPAFSAGGDPSEQLTNPASEARARKLFKEIRCVMCQNESIDDSHALIAGDLRKVVRQQIAAGADDEAIKSFLVQRYGEFVLLRPRFSLGNALLWTVPFLIVLAGVAFLFAKARRLPVPDAPLTPEEVAALERLSDNNRNS